MLWLSWKLCRRRCVQVSQVLPLSCQLVCDGPGLPKGGKCGVAMIVTVERDATGFATLAYFAPQNQGCRLGHFDWKTLRFRLS